MTSHQLRSRIRLALLFTLLGTGAALAACSSDDPAAAPEEDAGTVDARRDTGKSDAPPTIDTDSGSTTDSGKKDSATPDAGGGDADDDADPPAEGGSDATADAPADTNTPDVVVDTGSDVDAGCNALTHLGAVITPTANAAAPPAMNGGTLLDGTYVLTAVIDYNTSSPSGGTHRQTQTQTGAVTQLITTNSSGTQHLTGTLATVSGAGTYTITFTCGSVGAVTGTYRVTGTGYERTQTGLPNQVFVYTKQ